MPDGRRYMSVEQWLPEFLGTYYKHYKAVICSSLAFEFTPVILYTIIAYLIMYNFAVTAR